MPIFQRWTTSLKNKPRILVEPFVGGGIMSFTALFENWAEMVVMVEFDDDVASVWQTSFVVMLRGWLIKS